jgi:kynurenine formamidase
MIFSVEINNRAHTFDLGNPLVISIPLDFCGAQPNAYNVERASAKACKAGEIVGDTRRGGSCNFEQIQLIPHCNGTHTESIGHITHERISIHECLKDAFVPAILISVEPENALSSGENYSIQLSESDRLITKKLLKKPLESVDKNWLEALIIRTLPNDASKSERDYADEIPPFFSSEAMQFIVESGVKHLLVDLPSIDRLFDEGRLSNHRIFWRMPINSFEANRETRINSTVTELIYVSGEIPDGKYLLNLQIPAFVSDAAPSRPILFPAI